MKKIYITVLFFLSTSVLAHSPMHNDFESMMKRVFNQMQMMDMHHNHMFDKLGNRFANNRLISVNHNDNKNNITLEITLEGMEKEDLDINVKKNVLIIRAEKVITSESSHTKQLYTQQFLIPKNADKSAITASFEDGILIVTIPKIEKIETEVQQIKIQ